MDILRVKAVRGGKTVTVVKNSTGIGLPEKEQLARTMQRACGIRGIVKVVDGKLAANYNFFVLEVVQA